MTSSMGRLGVAGWTRHIPSQGGQAAWHPHGALQAMPAAEPWGGGLSAARSDSALKRASTKGRGSPVPAFKAKRKRPQQGGILAQHISLTLLPAQTPL